MSGQAKAAVHTGSTSSAEDRRTDELRGKLDRITAALPLDRCGCGGTPDPSQDDRVGFRGAATACLPA